MQSADPLADLLILQKISTPTFRGFRKDYVFPGRDLFLQITHIYTQEMQMFMTTLMHMLLHNFLISRVYGHLLVIRLSFSKIQTHYTQF